MFSCVESFTHHHIWHKVTHFETTEQLIQDAFSLNISVKRISYIHPRKKRCFLEFIIFIKKAIKYSTQSLALDM